MGSGIRRRLLIESKEGQRFEVKVTEVVFNQAQIGEWIKADEKTTEFSAKEIP
ncbi:MAG: hypothetical protein K1X72_15830 [Pyrinomonadaceae bacterium]|nr:hypothetical protein [Pyrinomonadaceae bacterium]